MLAVGIRRAFKQVRYLRQATELLMNIYQMISEPGRTEVSFLPDGAREQLDCISQPRLYRLAW
jgi:hypothetical protein